MSESNEKTDTDTSRKKVVAFAVPLDEIHSPEPKRLHELGTEMRTGEGKETAGTGTHKDQLHGAAEHTTRLANLGGGSKKSGGGGMKKGEENQREYSELFGKLGEHYHPEKTS